MIKRGVYCSKTKEEVEERHGGVTTKDYFYNHFAFYVPVSLVGFYGGSRMWLDPYLKKQFTYKGEIQSITSDTIVFTVEDQFYNDQWLFEGTVANELLYIRGVRKSQPEKIWLEDAFEYIGPD